MPLQEWMNYPEAGTPEAAMSTGAATGQMPWMAYPEATPAAPPAPEAKPISKIIGSDAEGAPVFADPADQAQVEEGQRLANQAVLRGATFGLSDKAIAAGSAALEGLSDKNMSPGGSSFGERYQTNLAGRRADQQKLETIAPGAETILGLTGSLGTAPLLPLGAAATTLGKIAQAAKVGGGIGMASGFGHTNDESLGGDLAATATGGMLGAATGGALGLAGDRVVAPLMNWVARRFGPEAADSQGVQIIANKMKQDQSAGGPGANDMLDLLTAAQDKPQALVDVAGENVKALGGRLARAPGESRQIATDFLTSRDKDAGGRISQDINAGISSGGSAYTTADAMMDARAQSARPLYESAGVPSNPKLYPQAPQVDTPAVQRLLDKSSAVQRAIAQAKQLPDYADLPDTSMVLLDKAYKNIGGMANEAKIAGNGESARDLNSLRAQLKDAITGGDPNHPYNKALDTFSGQSTSIDAVRNGQKIFDKRPEEIVSDMAALNPSDREFYRLGAADAAHLKIAKTGMGGDEAKRLIGNDYTQSQLRPLFDNKADYDRFIANITAENRMFNTKQSLIGGSDTARRMAEDASGGSEGAMGHFVRGAAAGIEGAPIAAGLSMVKGLGALTRGEAPDVNAAMARILFNPSSMTDPKLISDLARLTAAQNQRRGPPMLMAPAASAAGSAYPKLMSLPFLPQGQGQ